MRSLFAILPAVAAALAVAAPAVAAPNCDLMASPSGSDGASGTAQAPLRTPQALADHLAPGQTGCLRAGTYPGRGSDHYVIRFNHGGHSGKPITVRSAPGERAVLAGIVYVPKGSDDVTLSDVDVTDDTSWKATGITIAVDAKRTTFLRDSITNNGRKTCMILGVDGYGRAVDTVIRDGVFHNCGDPRNGVLDHAIYAEHVTGLRVTGNIIRDTGGYGVQFYPDAKGSIVRGNVFMDNGGAVVFAGDPRYASRNNLVTENYLGGSTKRPDLNSSWEARTGKGNHAVRNCIDAPLDDHAGFSVSGNVVGHIDVDTLGRITGTGSCGSIFSRLPASVASRLLGA